jgi:hypothetical protein
MGKIAGTLYEDVCRYMAMPRRILLELGKVSEKFCKENKKKFFFSKIIPFTCQLQNSGYGRTKQHMGNPNSTATTR